MFEPLSAAKKPILAAPSNLLQRSRETRAGADAMEREAERVANHISPTGAAYEEEKLNRKEDATPAIVREPLRGAGEPLDAASRAFFEPRFGQDFSRVRVHTDARAAESARAVNARAYAVGDNIVFGARQYAPSTPAGKRLIAHELTHTLQQDATGTGVLQRSPDDKGKAKAEEKPPNRRVR